MSHFPPPAAHDVIYREDGAGRGRRRPRWLPLAAAGAAVAVLGVVGVTVFGGDDGGGATAPWRLARYDIHSDVLSLGTLKGSSVTFQSLGEFAADDARADPRSTILAGFNDAGTLLAIDTATGEQRALSVEADADVRRMGDVLLVFGADLVVDLRSGAVMTPAEMFGQPADVNFFQASATRGPLVAVSADEGTGVFDSTQPDIRHWYDGVFEDAAGSRVVVGTLGGQRILTLYDGDTVVGSPITVDQRVRVRLLADGDTALAVGADGSILRLDFAAGTATAAGAVAAEVMAAVGDGSLAVFFPTDERILVSMGTEWALLRADGSLVQRYTPSSIEPGATELIAPSWGTKCALFVAGGAVDDRTAVIDLESGEVLVDVAGSSGGKSSSSGCSLRASGAAELLVVDGKVVDVPGELLAVDAEFTAAVVQPAGAGSDTPTALLYELRNGELVNPIELEAGDYLYRFVPSADSLAG